MDRHTKVQITGDCVLLVVAYFSTMNKQNGAQATGRAHVLGLPSWYPSGEDDHNGLFCLAQLDALATVGHQVGIVAAVPHLAAKEIERVEVQQHSWGAACVARYRSGTIPLLQALRYCLAMHKAWKLYQITYGRPQYALVLVAWKAGLFARWLRARYGISYKIIEHWSIYISDQYINTPIYLKCLFKWIFSGSQAVGAVSLPLAHALRAHKLSSESPVIVPNVVDTEIFRQSAEVSQIAGYEGSERETHQTDFSPLLLHVSNLAEVKNFGFVLDVFCAFRKRFSNARLWVAGAFNPTEARNRYASKCPNVEWVGFTDSQTLARQYRQATALLVTSHHETFSIVTAEAMACGCPVISSPLPALEAFDAFGTHRSLHTHDPEQWAEILECWTESRPMAIPGVWEGIQRVYGKESVGKLISQWIINF